jgi:hypothetical protein
LAVSEDGLNVLFQHSDLTRTDNFAHESAKPVSLECLAEFCKDLQRYSTSQNLMATLTRTILTAGVRPELPAQKKKRKQSSNSVQVQQVELFKGDDGTQTLVNTIYQVYKIGRIEPSEAFIRLSSKQERLDDSHVRSPREFNPPLKPSKSNMALVYGRGSFNDSVNREVQTGLCMWILNGKLDSSTVRDAISEFWVRDSLYTTVLEERKYKTSDYRSGNNNDDRNLEIFSSSMSAEPRTYLKNSPKRTYGELAMEWRHKLGVESTRIRNKGEVYVVSRDGEIYIMKIYNIEKGNF